jgi:hypothetical protein
MSEPIRHHYIPVFYLKPWNGPDQRLCEYSRPYKTTKALRKHPAATGYVDGLYTVPGLPAEDAQFVERSFMKANDDWAARAHTVFLNTVGPARDISQKEKFAWARFLYSLIVRNPENIDRMKREAPKYDMSAADVAANLPTLINSERVIVAIAEMRFHTIQPENSRFSFLTSDRPIIMTNGLAVPEAHIAMPLSPRRLFIATKSPQLIKDVAARSAGEVVLGVNNKVAEQARRFVYGVDDSQLRFVANRLGKMVRSTPLE